MNPKKVQVQGDKETDVKGDNVNDKQTKKRKGDDNDDVDNDNDNDKRRSVKIDLTQKTGTLPDGTSKYGKFPKPNTQKFQRFL